METVMEKIHVRMALGVMWNGEQVFIRPDGRQVVIRRGAMIAVPKNAERDLTCARASRDKSFLLEGLARPTPETLVLRNQLGIRSIPNQTTLPMRGSSRSKENSTINPKETRPEHKQRKR